MPVQNDKTFALLIVQQLQSLALFTIFTGKGFVAETAEFMERRRLDKHKRPMQETAANGIPTLRTGIIHAVRKFSRSQQMVAPPAMQLPDWISLTMSVNKSALG